MSDKHKGRQLAADLISDDAKTVTTARQELSEAPPSVTDPCAKQLVRFLKAGGDTTKAAAEALYHRQGPRFGPLSHSRLLVALQLNGAPSDPALGTQHSFMSRGRDGKYLQKLETSRMSDRTDPTSRVLSIATQYWTWPIVGLAALFTVSVMVQGGNEATYAGLGLAAVIVMVAAIDVVKRRCPKCRKFLAADLLSMYRDSNELMVRNWHCVYCKHRWRKN